ncbi:MAG: Hint domain-containing protein [Roseovarius sp.]|nr:Hint domain-containing protein [Roseovarius autotrophicus]
MSVTRVEGDNGANLIDEDSLDDTEGDRIDTFNAPDGAKDDVVEGFGGNDSLDGGPGNDKIEGGPGDDLIFAGSGNDVIFSGAGNDTINVGSGNNVAFGGDDRDTFTGFDPDFNNVAFGGNGGDDFDTLDFGDSVPTGGSFTIREMPVPGGTGTNGKVTFFDDDGKKTGQIVFKNIENVVPCFTPGTLIATPRGEVPVEHLREGDRVITRDNGMQEIRWIGARSLDAGDLMAAPTLRPVLIRAGALGNGLPERDMLVSPQHRLLLTSERAALYFGEREVLAAARHLTGMAGIDEVQASGVTYVHFLCDRHEVVLSDGAWTESFQPGEQVMDGMGAPAREEIFTLFPELRDKAGIATYRAARRSLKRHEARLLVE